MKIPNIPIKVVIYKRNEKKRNKKYQLFTSLRYLIHFIWDSIRKDNQFNLAMDIDINTNIDMNVNTYKTTIGQLFTHQTIFNILFESTQFLGEFDINEYDIFTSEYSIFNNSITLNTDFSNIYVSAMDKINTSHGKILMNYNVKDDDKNTGIDKVADKVIDKVADKVIISMITSISIIHDDLEFRLPAKFNHSTVETLYTLVKLNRSQYKYWSILKKSDMLSVISSYENVSYHVQSAIKYYLSIRKLDCYERKHYDDIITFLINIISKTAHNKRIIRFSKKNDVFKALISDI